MNRIFLFFFMVFFSSCLKQDNTAPVWINAKDSLAMPQDKVLLKLDKNENKREVILYTAVKPIALIEKASTNHFEYSLPNNASFIHGKARLCIVLENSLHFSNPFYLNHSIVPAITNKDVRSPKTVIPDSSLKQQSILFKVDGSQNLLVLDNNQFGKETWRELAPTVSLNRSESNAPESSYYVLAGSATAIQLNFIKEEQKNILRTNILKDAHGNTLADGTNCVFILKDALGKITRIEKLSLKGVASIPAPKYISLPCQAYVQIHKVKSNTVLLR